MFLKIEDLNTAIREEIMDEISREDDTIVEQCISAALGEMKGYLTSGFDVDTIFAKTGSNRDPLLLSFAKDIAVYNLSTLETPGIDLEDRRARYKRAIDWLKQVRDGEITTSLPVLTLTPETSPIKIGYQERKEYRY